MVIRQSRKTDEDTLTTLIAAFRVELARLRGQHTAPDLAAAREELGGYSAAGHPIIVAENPSGSLAGYLICRVIDDVVWAESLYVKPVMRRQGVGTALYTAAEALAVELGQDTVYNWVHPDNDSIITFLCQQGYDVLNLIELRRPRSGEDVTGTIRVGAHRFRYGQAAKPEIILRPLTAADKEWIHDYLVDHWGSTVVVSRGRRHDASTLPGFVVELNDHLAGLVTYHISDDQCELVTIDSGEAGVGIGSRLITAVRAAAVAAGCRRLWLITTNDNVDALRFYQKRGFRLKAVHPNAIAESRRLKPQIPKIGCYGIPIRDEIELEILLSKEIDD